ncbi:MAG TPA: histidine kinase dimerization/phosphoacceptor domain -containing protein [Pseudomonas sp.]
MKQPNEFLTDPVQLGEREFRELADNAPVMIWRSRPDKLCDWFNQRWTTFTGKTLEQLIGYGWADDVHVEDIQRCVSTYHTAFDARTSYTLSYRLRRGDGEFRWLLDNGAPYYRNGEFAGYFGSCIDITDQREMEEQQRVLLSELNHRVKNNLQLIISLLQISNLRAKGDEAKALLQTAITRITGIGAVQDELHRSSNGRIDLADYLPKLARGVIKAQSGGLSTLCAETQSVHVSLQMASNLGLMLNELMGNAVKHCQGGPDSRIGLYLSMLDDGTAQIAVTDDGKGFSEETLAQFSQPRGKRTINLIDALSQRCKARIMRDNLGPEEGTGARVKLVFALDDGAAKSA